MTDLDELFERLASDTRQADMPTAQTIRRRGDARTRRQRIVVATAGVAVVAGAVASITTFTRPTPSSIAVRPSPSPSVPSTRPEWRQIPPAPIAGRHGEGVVWTGQEMLVWGGTTGGADPQLRADGAAYNPATNRWRKLAPAPAGLVGLADEGAAWTGTQALFWVGNSPDGPVGAALYDPRQDRWQRLPAGPLGAREGYASLWTGTELLIIGGAQGDTAATPAAAALNPQTGVWRLLPALNKRPGLALDGAVWDGEHAWLSGIEYTCPPPISSTCQQSHPVLLRYNPATDELATPSSSSAPRSESRLVGRLGGHTLVFDASHDQTVQLAFYDTAGTMWRMSRPVECQPGDSTNRKWTDQGYAVACGRDSIAFYRANSDTWTTYSPGRSLFNANSGSAIVWTGGELVVWSGSTNETYNPTPNVGARTTLP